MSLFIPVIDVVSIEVPCLPPSRSVRMEDQGIERLGDREIDSMRSQTADPPGLIDFEAREAIVEPSSPFGDGMFGFY